MDYATFNATRAGIEANLASACTALERARREAAARLGIEASGPMGLTPDAIKADPAYRQAWAAVRAHTEAARAFNGRYLGRFKKEEAAAREARPSPPP